MTKIYNAAEEIQRFLGNLYGVAEFLTPEELMNFEFIKAYGVYEFIEDTNDQAIIYRILDLCDKIDKKLYDLSDTSSRWNSPHLREIRRVSKRKAIQRIIKLGGADVYGEDGTLDKSSGIVYKKVRAARLSRKHDAKFCLRLSQQPLNTIFKHFPEMERYFYMKPYNDELDKLIDRNNIRGSLRLIRKIERYEGANMETLRYELPSIKSLSDAEILQYFKSIDSCSHTEFGGKVHGKSCVKYAAIHINASIQAAAEEAAKIAAEAAKHAQYVAECEKLDHDGIRFASDIKN